MLKLSVKCGELYLLNVYQRVANLMASCLGLWFFKKFEKVKHIEQVKESITLLIVRFCFINLSAHIRGFHSSSLHHTQVPLDMEMLSERVVITT